MGKKTKTKKQCKNTENLIDLEKGYSQTPSYSASNSFDNDNTNNINLYSKTNPFNDNFHVTEDQIKKLSRGIFLGGETINNYDTSNSDLSNKGTEKKDEFLKNSRNKNYFVESPVKIRKNGQYVRFNEIEKINYGIKLFFLKLKKKVFSEKRSNRNVSKEFRQIHVLNRLLNAQYKYIENNISTTKYNFVTFVPKFLFEQFSKYSNLFFLVTSSIQQIPNVSPTNRFTTIGTLTIVLIISAAKEITEDIKRANADKYLNNMESYVFDIKKNRFLKKKWIDIKVGDLVKIENNESFPADIVLISSSEPEGLCYVETSSLDGETNLKIKQARPETASLIEPEILVKKLSGSKIISENSNSNLYSYDGVLKDFVDDDIPLVYDQLLLRGAGLKNTQWIYGLVITTGHETKLMRNATAAPIKKTSVEKIINLQIIALFCVLIVLSTISSLGCIIKLLIDSQNLGYLMLDGISKIKLFFLDLLTFWILFSNLVPISLFVTIEIIKYYQAYMISSDLDLYHHLTDTPAGVKTSSLVEELGQIKYIFTDKTGTLTQNIMEFKCCSIVGRCYIKEIPEDQKAQIIDNIEYGFHSLDQLEKDLMDKSTNRSQYIDEFLTILSVCHTVIPDWNEIEKTINYQSASPDEGALVDGARHLGYQFLIRKPKTVTIFNKLKNVNEEYELLSICEFTSKRKRMSSIFRCPDNSIRLFCKGADSVILKRLSSDTPQHFINSTLKHLENFASSGLRTLCIASRIISEKEFSDWIKKHKAASSTMEDRSESLNNVAELIERDLFLIGATAIEDKLQDEVPETIQTLQNSGIKFWVLTGDRQETAINIGMSCKLLSEDMNLLIINEEDKESTRLNIQEKLKALNFTNFNFENDLLDFSLALIIDGQSLQHALDPELEDQFIELGFRCKTVICCRVSPLQKALVVKTIKKKKLDSLLLAIGDGANDVSMIQAAHVGVGISGMEGLQAARNADVSIGQFKFLKKLLLVHGSWSYRRISNAILYSFYKNITLYMTQFWFVFLNCFSGQTIVESWTLISYNVLFTFFPPFVMGIFDQFVNAKLLDRYPQLYKLGQSKQFFNVKIFWGWIINGFFHSAIIFGSITFIQKYGNVLSNGLVLDNWSLGTTVFTLCLLTVLGKAALVVTIWTKFTFFAIPGSFILWIFIFPIYSFVAPPLRISNEVLGVFSTTFKSPIFWFTAIIISFFCLLRDFAWKFFKRSFTPESYHFIQEIQKYDISDSRPRMEQFEKTIRKVRQVQRIKKQRGFAFSQAENQNQEKILGLYDTTKKRGKYNNF